MAGAVSRAASWQGLGALPVLGTVMPQPAKRPSLQQLAMWLSLLPDVCVIQQHGRVQHSAHASQVDGLTRRHRLGGRSSGRR